MNISSRAWTITNLLVCLVVNMSFTVGVILLVGLIASGAVGFIFGRCSAVTKDDDFYDDE